MKDNKLNETKLTCNNETQDQIITTSNINISQAKTITPKAYTDFDCHKIKTADIEEVRRHYNESKIGGISIALEIVLGVSTTILGVIISSIFASYKPESFAFWMCYLAMPIVLVILISTYIILRIVSKVRNDDFKKVVYEKILKVTESEDKEGTHE